jgi:prevent-host-death family protein
MNRVGVADLKAHLSQHLRRVKGGRTLIILDRNTPIARIVPFGPSGPIELRGATRKAASVRRAKPTTPPTDSLRLLLEDRAGR